MKNITDIMKQAKALQSKMEEMQASLETLEVEGSSGAGLVRVVVNGKGFMRQLHIDPSLMVESEREILEDLVVAAFNDAKAKAEAAAAEQMKALTGGMGLPPGLGL
ncbi:MAG: YbaB/EbfC family nucleoid-associated protein [Rhizobiales bacterium]|nr:YbaB/EbfC family nucleoid-associated protein [Hyphomicrobiales bacterium]